MVQNGLIGAGLRVFPCWLRYNHEKNKYAKGPAIPKGTSWQTVDPHDPTLDWSSGTVGVVIPEGVVVLDLDTQKGITTQHVEQFLGVRLDWDAALIQTTPSGGAHYAFKTTKPIHQRSDWIVGFDTRTSGQGFICSGAGYKPAGHFGPVALAAPDTLPELPTGTPIDQADTVRTTTAPTREDLDTTTLIQALHHIDPTNRAEWLLVGMGLKHYFTEDPEQGFGIFDQWSKGAFWPGGEPSSYDPDTQGQQWDSFKADKGGREVTVASIFHKAIQEGWNPPRGIDTAAAFGGQGVATEQYDSVVDSIMEYGGNAKKSQQLIAEIQSLGGSPIQRAMLSALLRRELKENDLLTKELSAVIDSMIGVSKDGGNIQGMYGKNQAHNAITFIDKRYPDGTLVRVQETFYGFDGRIWVELSDDEVEHQVTVELLPTSPSASVIAGTLKIVKNCVQRSDLKLGDIPKELVVFRNCVLDVNSLEMFPHDKSLFTTNILPFDYNPYAVCPNWLAFLYDTLDHDVDTIALLQEWIGYLMTNDYSHQKIMMLLGPPRCGKGTIGLVINKLVGDENFSGGDIESLCNDKFLETLPTKTVMFDGDVQKAFPRSTSQAITRKLKGISGGDKISVPRLYKKPLSAYLPTRFTIAGNNVPRLFDDSGALGKRMLIVPFKKTFYGREDLALINKLSSEIEGIANWALQGLARLNTNGKFTTSMASLQEIEELTENYSPLTRFVKECLTVTNDSGDFVPSKQLHEAYLAWSIAEGLDANMGQAAFTSALKETTQGGGVTYGPKRQGEKVQRGFSGVTLGKQEPATAAAFRPTE